MSCGTSLLAQPQGWQVDYVVDSARAEADFLGHAVALGAGQTLFASGLHFPGDSPEGGGVAQLGADASGRWRVTNYFGNTQNNVDDMGAAMDLAGDDLLVGAPRTQSPGTPPNAGAVFVYRRSPGGTWQFTQRLAPAFQQDARFGSAVAVDGEWALVGAPRFDTDMNLPPTAPEAGRLYFYRRNAAGTWTLRDSISLPANQVNAGDQLGYRVALKDSIAAAAAINRNQTGTIWTMALGAGDDWSLTEEILPPFNPGQVSNFGEALAISEGRLAASLPDGQGGFNPNGRVYFYRRQADGTWQDQGWLAASTGPGSERFGKAIALRGDTLAATSQAQFPNGNTATVHYFIQQPDSTWQQRAAFQSVPLHYDNAFGEALAFRNQTLAVGAQTDDSLQINHGGVYVFSIGEPMQLRASVQPPRCPGETGRMALRVSGGVPPYEFEWADGSTDSLRTTVAPGRYPVVVTDAAARQQRDTVRVPAPDSLQLRVDTVRAESCYGTADGRIELRARSGQPPYQYTWNRLPGDRGRSGLPPGDYRIRLTDSCGTRRDTTLRVAPGPDPQAALSLAGAPPVAVGAPLRLSNESVRADSFSWQIGQQTLADTRVPAGASFQRSGEQPLQLRAYANGCADTVTRTISVSGIAVALPSAFSPDGDGRNDRWQPYGPSAHLAGRLRVYSRWGELVHESSGQRPGWNGRCGGAPCPPGVYTYELQLRAGAEQITRRGTITLLR